MTENGDSLNPLRLDTVAFLLLLAVLPLVSLGATRDVEALWVLGLVLLVVGSLIPLVTEFGMREDEDSGDKEATEPDGS